MSDKQQTNYYKIIGRKDGVWYILDYTFEYGDGMKGATGSSFELLTQEQIDQRIEDYDRKELRQQAVQSGNCEQSLEDWKPEGSDAVEIVIDRSYCNEERTHELLKLASNMDSEDYEYTDCVGGGRCFDDEMFDPSWWDYLHDAALLEVIKKAETK